MSRLAHKRGRPSNYRKSLQNDCNWEEVKYKIRCRDGHSCACCGKNHSFEVHHISYFVSGESIRGHELDFLDWLILLCEDCHTLIHNTPSHPLNPHNKQKLDSRAYKQYKMSFNAS